MRRSYSEGKVEIEVIKPQKYTLKKNKYLLEENIDDHKNLIDDFDHEQVELNRSPCHEQSNERYSIVEMINSIQNSLDPRDSLSKSHANSDKNNLLRISFAKRINQSTDAWAEVQTSKYANGIIMESIKDPGDIFDDVSASEDINFNELVPSMHQFYTFSNRNSERRLNDKN